MKENIGIILKEVGICLGLAVIALGLNAFLFKNFLIDDVEIESARVDGYASIERNRYIVINADIQEQQNPTQTYETATDELDGYQTEYRYIQGTVNPFVSTNADVNDLPSEIIGSTVEE